MMDFHSRRRHHCRRRQCHCRRRDRRRRKNKPLEDETLAAEEPPSTRLTSPADESMIDFDDVLLVSSGPAHEE